MVPYLSLLYQQRFFGALWSDFKLVTGSPSAIRWETDVFGTPPRLAGSTRGHLSAWVELYQYHTRSTNQPTNNNNDKQQHFLLNHMYSCYVYNATRYGARGHLLHTLRRTAEPGLGG